MSKFYQILFWGIVILMVGCVSPADTVIERENLKQVSEELLLDDLKLDSTKVNLLNTLNTISNGRESYVEMLDDIIANSKISYDKLVVDEDRFGEIIDNVFNYFKDNKITYAQLFVELDTIRAIESRYEGELQSIYKEIDSYCVLKQDEIDIENARSAEIKAQLNEMVKLEVVGIRETKSDYRDVIEVRVKMTNNTSKPIEAIGFNLTITDKLGNELAVMRCRSNDRFVTSDIGVWTYERWGKSEIYEALKNTRLSHITAQQQITKINHGGELITASDHIDDLLRYDYGYETPKRLFGYCPYLEKEDELSKKVDKLQEALQDEIMEATPLLKEYHEISSDLIDYSKMFN